MQSESHSKPISHSDWTETELKEQTKVKVSAYNPVQGSAPISVGIDLSQNVMTLLLPLNRWSCAVLSDSPLISRFIDFIFIITNFQVSTLQCANTITPRISTLFSRKFDNDVEKVEYFNICRYIIQMFID